jgi:hypothetical protein
MKKRLCGLVLGLGLLTGCASTQNIEVYGLGHPIYPTGLTDAERVEMRDKETEASRIELQNKFQYRDMFGETEKDYGFNLLKVRF